MMMLERVTRAYRTDKRDIFAVRDASFAVRPGDYWAITGPSGSGKSTLVSLLGLLDRPTSGRLIAFDTDARTASANRLAGLRRRHIGFVFQGFHLVNSMSLLENVAMGLEGLERRRAIRFERAASVLTEVGLEARLDHTPRQLSGGQQQRAAIARALVKAPDLLICDEPTGSLDGQSALGLLKMLDDLVDRGTAVVVVTHDPEVAVRARNRIVIEAGRLVPATVPVQTNDECRVNS
jgi:putative ABC transport system ATP-binding protein